MVVLDSVAGRAYELVVDLGAKAIGPLTPLPADIQPAIMADEFAKCEEAVKPVATLGFSLKPAGFFARNPAMGVPPPVSAGASPPASTRGCVRVQASGDRVCFT